MNSFTPGGEEAPTLAENHFFVVIDSRPEEKTQQRGLNVARSRTSLVIQDLQMTDRGDGTFNGVRAAKLSFDAAKLCDSVSFSTLMRTAHVWKSLPGNVTIELGQNLPVGCVPEPLVPTLAIGRSRGRGRGRGRGAGALALPGEHGPVVVADDASTSVVAKRGVMTVGMHALVKVLIEKQALSSGAQLAASSIADFNEEAVRAQAKKSKSTGGEVTWGEAGAILNI